ncbi:Hypothetical protein FKW44_014239, partial [Caligus rogercresseyi]
AAAALSQVAEELASMVAVSGIKSSKKWRACEIQKKNEYRSGNIAFNRTYLH